MRGVSVVLPTVRLDPWLDDAVASVLASEDVEVELIVVHDGVAPDPTLPWARDPRVKLVHHSERRGLAQAIRSGMAVASHDLVARLDADDLARPERMRVQSAYLDENPDVVAVGSRLMRIDDTGREIGELVMAVGEDIRPHLLLQNVVAHSSLMLRAGIVNDIGGYNAEMRQMEDYDLLLRLALRGPIAVVDQILIYYRLHGDQMSRGAAPTGIHIDRVMAGRRELRGALGKSRLTSAVKDVAWRTVQFLRYYRLRRPGYER